MAFTSFRAQITHTQRTQIDVSLHSLALHRQYGRLHPRSGPPHVSLLFSTSIYNSIGSHAPIDSLSSSSPLEHRNIGVAGATGLCDHRLAPRLTPFLAGVLESTPTAIQSPSTYLDHGMTHRFLQAAL